MKGILADNNIKGHLKHMLRVWEGPYWREVWQSLSLTVHTFERLGLADNVSDSVLCELCQEREIVLLAANRNEHGPDSLAATIRSRGRPTNLPIFTLADADRVLLEPTYANRVAERLLEYFFIIDQLRGTGRLYVP